MSRYPPSTCAKQLEMTLLSFYWVEKIQEMSQNCRQIGLGQQQLHVFVRCKVTTVQLETIVMLPPPPRRVALTPFPPRAVAWPFGIR